MKTIRALLLMAMVCVGPGSAFAQEAAAELKKLDAKLTDAFKNKDIKFLAKHTADDYKIVDPRGHVHSREKYFKHLSEGTAKFEELKETDVKAMVHGDAGFVTGLLHVKGKVGEKMINAEYRWTRVYYKSGGEWVCIFEQHTHVMPKEEKKKS